MRRRQRRRRRQRERQTDKQTDRERHRHTHRHRDTETDRKTHTHTHARARTHTHTHTSRQRERARTAALGGDSGGGGGGGGSNREQEKQQYLPASCRKSFSWPPAPFQPSTYAPMSAQEQSQHDSTVRNRLGWPHTWSKSPLVPSSCRSSYSCSSSCAPATSDLPNLLSLSTRQLHGLRTGRKPHASRDASWFRQWGGVWPS